jgi:hypothetical protein
MNKRIEELSLQCIRYKLVAEGARSDFDYKKFAELIMEEMYVFMCNATDNDKPWPSFKEVKQHFGVEE